jgi:hypothetical protein
MGDHCARGPVSEDPAETNFQLGARKAGRTWIGVALSCAAIGAGVPCGASAPAGATAPGDPPARHEFVPLATLPMPFGPIIMVPETSPGNDCGNDTGNVHRPVESDGDHGHLHEHMHGQVLGQMREDVLVKQLMMLDPSFVYALVPAGHDDDADDDAGQDDVAAVMGMLSIEISSACMTASVDDDTPGGAHDRSAPGGGAAPPLISVTLTANNTGVDPTQYMLLLPRPVGTTIAPPSTIRGGLTLVVRDLDGTGDARVETFDAFTPIYAAFVDTMESPEHELFEAPWGVSVMQPFGDESAMQLFAADPVPPITEALFVTIRARIFPQTSFMFTVELESRACPGDCAPINADGSIGSGLITIDDLIAVVLQIGGDVGDSACDVSPVFADESYGNGVINLDDIIAMLNLFGTCP